MGVIWSGFIANTEVCKFEIKHVRCSMFLVTHINILSIVIYMVVYSIKHEYMNRLFGIWITDKINRLMFIDMKTHISIILFICVTIYKLSISHILFRVLHMFHIYLNYFAFSINIKIPTMSFNVAIDVRE